jgi:hypothetical protein
LAVALDDLYVDPSFFRLPGTETANRKYVSYEIEQSVGRGDGILGIRINNIKYKDVRTDPPGPIPAALIRISATTYIWQYGKLGEWVDRAYKQVHPGS